MIRVCVAGATGWTGRAVTEGVLAAEDLELTGAVARSAAGTDVGVALGGEPVGVEVRASVDEALEGADVLIDYTSHTTVKGHVLTAIERGVAVVVGSSGLTAEDFAEIDEVARRREVGVVAAGNFSLTAAMGQAAALLVARHLPNWEVIDYAGASKRDVPSGTARELAERLGELRPPDAPDAQPQVDGPVETRGATIGGAQLHCVRLPGYLLATEVTFGLDDERLSIRSDAGPTPTPYVGGTLLAARAAVKRVGLTRGLDTLLVGG
jgi:4-hydroxy-tetrahydrodipicolinate reductase